MHSHLNIKIHVAGLAVVLGVQPLSCIWSLHYFLLYQFNYGSNIIG